VEQEIITGGAPEFTPYF